MLYPITCHVSDQNEKKKKQEAKEEQEKADTCVVSYFMRLLILFPFNELSNGHFIDLPPELEVVPGDSMWGQ